jgi:hypothetical protein
MFVFIKRTRRWLIVTHELRQFIGIAFSMAPVAQMVRSASRKSIAIPVEGTAKSEVIPSRKPRPEPVSQPAKVGLVRGEPFIKRPAKAQLMGSGRPVMGR